MPTTTGEHWGRWAILLAMALLLPICGWSLSRIKAENNVEDWVGKDNIAAQKYAWYRQHFPGEDSLFVTWKDSRLDDPRLPRLIDQLLGPDIDGQRRGGFPEFASVKTPHEFIRRIEDSANLSRAEAVATLDGLLIGSGPVCVRLTSAARARVDTVGPLFEAELARLGLDAKVLAPLPRPERSLSTTDTAYNHEELAETWALWEPHDLRISGPGLRPHRGETKRLLHRLREWRLPELGGPVVERAFFLPGSPVALSIKLSPLGEENRTETFRKLRQTAVAVGIPEADLVLGGRAVTGSALNRAVMNAFWNHDAVWYRPYEKSLVLTCGAISGLLAFWILRSLRLATLVIGLAMYVTLVCMALVPILGGVPEWEALTGSTGKMNLVLVVLPPLILVTTLSGSIHLVTYWRHMAAREPRGAVAKAVAAASRPCFWSSGTTALGLVSLVVSTLQPIRDFGLYGSLGMMIALAAILYGLSALLQLIPLRTPSLEEVESPWWRRFGDLLTRWATPIVGVSLVFGAVCALGLGRLRTETKPIRYFSNESRIVQEYEWLENHLAGVAPLQVVVRFDPAAQQDIRFLHRAEIVRHVQQSLREVPDVTGAISLADVLPRIADPGPHAPAGEQRMFLLKSKQVQERVARRAGTNALWKRALEPTRFNTAGDELWVISAHSLAMSDTQYVDLSRDIETVCGQALQRALAAHPAEGPRDVTQTLTGVVPLFMVTQDELLTSLWRSFLLASLTIGVAMMVQLRSITAGLLAMLPNVTPIAIVFGLAAWLGVALDIGTIVTASIAMGIAVDGTLHMINWFDQRLGQGLSRKQAAVEAVVHCGPAMWQTGLIVCAGMFVLWPSELMLISRFGVFMTAVVFTASVADTVFTPALLAGPLGWVLERKRRGRVAPKSVNSVT